MVEEAPWKAWSACQSANFNRSIRRSQLITGFQLALFWSTNKIGGFRDRRSSEMVSVGPIWDRLSSYARPPVARFIA
jgi:hypothetical protein